MLTKSLISVVALFILFAFTGGALAVSGNPASSSQFPPVQIAAAPEKGEEAKEESMEKSKEGMSKKEEKKKMKKENKKKKKGETKKPSED